MASFEASQRATGTIRREAQRLTLVTDIIWRVKRTEIPVSVATLRGEASLSLDPGHADGAVHESILWHTLWYMNWARLLRDDRP